MQFQNAIAALVSLSLTAAAGPDEVAKIDRTTGISIESASAEWTRRVEWGLARFHAAGLALPPIAINVHGDNTNCGGNTGLFRPLDPVEVHLCSSSPVESRMSRLITLHEMAHAWAETQLNETERAAFLRLRGLDAWADPRIPRHEWGAEHAAEVVSWGLMDEPVPIVRIYRADPHELAVAFKSLVHRSPLWAPPGA